MKLAKFLLLMTIACISGCAHLVAPLSSNDIDRFEGKRTFGSRIEDQSIEFKAQVNIQRKADLPKSSRVSATSWNGQLLLTGQVQTAEARSRSGEIAAAIRQVQFVHNELEAAPRISLLARMNDSWITTRVKMRLLFGPDVPGRRVKVVTENGVVYLMGLLNHVEAEQAVQTARQAYGVQKIVKIFEYIGQTAD